VNVGIAGGGIGGLTLALLLERRGVQAEVWERTAAPRPDGLGVLLGPASVGVYRELGLGVRIAELAVELQACTAPSPSSPAHGAPSPAHGAPCVALLHGELLALLQRATRERLGPGALRCGLALVSVQPAGARVRALLEEPGPAGAARRAREVDLLVGADGTDSAVRASLTRACETPDPLRYSNRRVWQGSAERPPVLDGRSSVALAHGPARMCAFPLSEPLRLRGRARIGWVAELPSPPGPCEPGRTLAERRELATLLGPLRSPDVDVPALVAATEHVYTRPLVDRDPLRRWSHGAITLLGDAAHPLATSGSEGADQAVLDAAALAAALGTARDVASALAAYEAERLPPTTALVRAHRQRLAHG
jgi:5-methylphenazine-1-carboxylate 1-monooxygenase